MTELLNKIQDKNLDEIINLLVLEEITLNEFNRNFCQEYPTLWFNILCNFQTFENFERHIKAWITIESAAQEGITISFLEALEMNNFN